MKILIVGDSHAEEIVAGHLFTEVEYELTEAWTQKRNGISSKHIHKKYFKLNKNGVDVGMTKNSFTAYNVSFDLVYDVDSYNNPESYCFFWLGTNDITLVSQHPDIDNTTKAYVEKILSRLDKANIQLIYPPQSPFFMAESYYNFCKSLAQSCRDFGLNEPIHISEILDNIDIGDRRNYQDPLHLHRHLYVRALDNIIDNCKNGGKW